MKNSGPYEIPSILKRPENRLRLAELLDREIMNAEARASAEESERLLEIERGERLKHDEELARCAADELYWFNHWVWTYDPRLVDQPDPENPGKTLSPYLQFKPWPRQAEFLKFVEARIQANESFGVPKSRDQGVTYLMCGKAVHKWLFTPGFKTTFSSRVSPLVDTRGNPDSIFEKIRIILRRLPFWMLPNGFSWGKHDLSMLLTNPATDATITGEGGDNIGRGGRSKLHVVDEAAHLEHPLKAEAAILGSADCVAWVSTTNLPDDFFCKKVFQVLPPERVFKLSWRDDPRKDDAWAEKKRAELTDEATWQTEFEINPYARVEGVTIPAIWVQAAQALARRFPEEMKRLNPAVGVAGGDVGGGKAKSTLVIRYGHIVMPAAQRGDPDTTETALWMLNLCKEAKVPRLMFDAVGIGAGVSSTLARSIGYPMVTSYPVNVGIEPTNRVWPDDRHSYEMFGNLKAELWWLARNAFKRSYELERFLSGKSDGVMHPIQDCLLLPNSNDQATSSLISELSIVKWTHNDKGKIVIETKKELQKRGVKSPDHAEAFVLTFAEPKTPPAWTKTTKPPPVVSIYGR